MTALGDTAREAQRAKLLATLDACGWNMSEAARRLGIGRTPNVLRAIRSLGLTAEYDAARADGRIRKGRKCLQLTHIPGRAKVAA